MNSWNGVPQAGYPAMQHITTSLDIGGAQTMLAKLIEVCALNPAERMRLLRLSRVCLSSSTMNTSPFFSFMMKPPPAISDILSVRRKIKEPYD